LPRLEIVKKFKAYIEELEEAEIFVPTSVFEYVETRLEVEIAFDKAFKE